MFKNPKTIVMMAQLIDHLQENESPGLFDEAVEMLHNELKRRCELFYDHDIAELMQCEVNAKLFIDSKYRINHGN